MKYTDRKHFIFDIFTLLNTQGIMRYSVLAVLYSALLVLIPFLTGELIDTLVYGGSPFIVFFCLAGATFVALLMNIWAKNMIHNIARKKELDLQIRLLSAFQSMAPSATDDYKNGEVAMKFFRDTGMVSLFLSNHYPMLLGASASILLALVMVLYKNPLIALLYLVFLPLMVVALLPYSKCFRHLNHAVRTLYDKSMNGIFEFMQVFPYLKLMDVGDRYAYSPKARFRSFRKMNSKNDCCIVLFEGINKFILFLGEYFILGVAGWLAWKKFIPVGDVVIFQMLFLSVLKAFSGLFQLLPSFEATAESIRSMDELLKSEETEDITSGEEISTASGDIVLRHITFCYPKTTRKIFDDFSCNIKGGSIVTVTGANGTGKTTFLRLVTGYLEPQKGSIEIASRKLSKWQKKSFRRRIASVFQDSLLITGTIRDNITLKNTDYTETEILEAIRLSGADSVIKRMPEGLEHRIGCDGGGLSGGERQKIAIARALIRKPDILIFDEVTNHLDYESRIMVKKLLVQMRGKTTIFLVSHDPDLIKLSDQEICL